MEQYLTPEFIGAAAVAIAALAGGAWAWTRKSRLQLEVEPETDEVAVPPADAEPGPRPAPGPSVAARFFAGLSRSRESLRLSLRGAVAGDAGIDAAVEALEEALIGADVGVRLATSLAEDARAVVQGGDEATLRRHLRTELAGHLGAATPLAGPPPQGPLVILVVGVNGSGKTTTIGKLAGRYARAGKSVILGAGDTYRAGAIEQLKVWGERADVPVIAHQEGADPAAVIFDAVKAGVARGADVVICDTAGRLQAQKTLMDELGKVARVVGKAMPGAPHEVLLVLDATIGQNALSQARIFNEVVGVTGVALTKLDGTAKGGVVVAVGHELGIPVKLVGLGEGIDDLRDFDPAAFLEALLPADDDADGASPAV